MTTPEECYKAHENIEEIHVSGIKVNDPLPTACYVCGFSPVTYAPRVVLYDPSSGPVGVHGVEETPG
jgi:hypothetical protein